MTAPAHRCDYCGRPTRRSTFPYEFTRAGVKMVTDIPCARCDRCDEEFMSVADFDAGELAARVKVPQ